MIRLAVEGCKRNHRHSGLCGQAPSAYLEMAWRWCVARFFIEAASVIASNDVYFDAGYSELEVRQ